MRVAVGFCQAIRESSYIRIQCYLPKVLTDFHLNQLVELRSLRETGEGQEESALCPVRALKFYIQRTAAFRKTDQLFICFGPQCLGEPVSKARLSRGGNSTGIQRNRLTGASGGKSALHAGCVNLLGLMVWRHPLRGMCGRYVVNSDHVYAVLLFECGCQHLLW